MKYYIEKYRSFQRGKRLLVIDTDYTMPYDTAKEAHQAIIFLYDEQNRLNDRMLVNYTTLIQLKAEGEPLLANQEIERPTFYEYIFKAVQRPAQWHTDPNKLSPFKTWKKEPSGLSSSATSSTEQSMSS